MGTFKEGRLERHDAVNSSSSRSAKPRVREDHITEIQSITHGDSLDQIYKHQVSRKISPPPLKRQRTNRDCRGSGPPSLLATSASDANVLRRSFDDGPFQSKVTRGNCEDKIIRQTRSSPESPVKKLREARDIMYEPWHNYIAPSFSSTSSQIPGKRTCRVCGTTATTSYNPIFKCSGCHRAYHDSCRKPPLVSGVDPQRWRCSKCSAVKYKKASKIHDASRKTSIVPLVQRTNSKRESWKVGECRLSSQQTPMFKPSPKFSSSMTLPESKSMPLTVQSDQPREQRKVAPSVSNGDSVLAISTNTTSGLFGDALLSDRRTLDALQEPHEVKSLRPLKRTKGLDNGSRISDALYSSEPDYAEILKTPTHKSRRFSLGNQPVNYDCGAESNGQLPATDQFPTGFFASLTVLCPTCRSQRVLAKFRSQTIQCRKCRELALVTESSKHEVLVTPRASSRIITTATPNAHQDTLNVTSPPVSTLESVIPWFQSNLVISKPKVKQRVGDFLKPNNLGTGPSQHLQQSYQCKESCGDVYSQEQISMCKDNLSDQSVSPSRIAAMHIAKTHTVKEKEIHAISYLSSGEDQCSLNKTSLTTRIRDRPLIDRNQNSAHILIPARTEAPILLTGTEPAITSKTISASEKNNSLQVDTTRSRLSSSDKRLTARELILIALSTTDECGMTTQEIIEWVTHTFTHLDKGTRSWESTIRSKISTMSELRREKVTGAGCNRKKCFIVDAATRADYRARFAHYCKTTAMPVSQSIGLSTPAIQQWNFPKDSSLIPSFRVKKSAPSIVDRPLTTKTPESATYSPRQDPSAVLSKNPSTRSIPFTRVVERIPKVNISYIEGVERETSYESFLKSQRTSDVKQLMEDTRTKKLAEIQARPSRKEIFGSDNRLGHVRRYGRKDIHDEREGAWKRRRVGYSATSPSAGEHTSLLDGSAATLRQVFDLPERAIPMNDGQAELAFRDGTRVNGRLPRSRQIFKVGKMSGGELTVRTS